MTSLNIQQSTQSSETVTSALIEKLYNLAMNSTVEDENNSLEMSLTGSIYSISAYESSVLYLREKFPNLTITIRDNNFYIKFADSEVERVLVNSDISTDHIGVSKSDVNRLIILPKNLFKNNTTIQSFNELQQFLSVQIGISCFEGCTNLNQINLSKVTTIGDNAFNGCNALSGSVNCPNLTSIGANAFKNCSNLQNITSLGLINKIQGSTFSGCTLLETAVLPSNTSIIEHNAFYNCLNLTTVSGLTHVTELGRDAFSGCSDLDITDWDLSSVTSLGQYAFKGCSKLKGTLNLSGVQTINALYTELFKNCSSLTKIILGSPGTIGGSYSNVSRSMFSGCDSLKVIDITQLDTLSVCNNVIIGSNVFEALIIRNSTTVPTVEKQPGYSGALRFNKIIQNSNARIYVPRAMLSTYANDSEWSAISSYILAIEDYTPSV